MPNRIDLHIHTLFSDGLASPKEVLEMVRKEKLKAFAICDHDNLAGYFETRKLLTDGDPELVAGVELSAGRDNEDLHILGYYFDPESKVLKKALDEFRKRRDDRGKKMLAKLKELGIDIPYETVMEFAGQSAIGRPHIADAMLKIGVVRSYESAFLKYIGNKGPAYVAKQNLSPGEAIDLIHKSGGLAFLAHPGVNNAGRHIDELLTLGLDGIEVYHPQHNRSQCKSYMKMAESKGLLAVGGSDYHGREGIQGAIGYQDVPVTLLEALKTRVALINRG
jgi:3',5'-nucleoside bisphosphate phosphatase